jgi:hypothetical protein
MIYYSDFAALLLLFSAALARQSIHQMQADTAASALSLSEQA